MPAKTKLQQIEPEDDPEIAQQYYNITAIVHWLPLWHIVYTSFF